MRRADGQRAPTVTSPEKRALPFPIRTLVEGEHGARRRFLSRWPAAGTELRLERLSALLGGEVRLAVDGLGRDARVAAADPALAVALAGPGGSRAVLGLPAGLAGRIVDLALGRGATPERAGLTTGEEGALLYALDRAAGDWLAAGGARFEIRGLLADVAQGAELLPEGDLWRVAARLAVPGFEGSVWLCCAAPSDGGARTAACLDPLPEAVAGWPAELVVEAGGARLPLAAVRDLAPGDLVVLDRLAHPDGATTGAAARLVSGDLSLDARWLDAARLEVISEAAGRTKMETPGDGGAVRAQTLDRTEGGGGPEVAVAVEVARIRMTVGEATGLLPGRIVELDRPVGAGVVLRVGDGRVAAGVLVEHEGALAVEITEVP